MQSQKFTTFNIAAHICSLYCGESRMHGIHNFLWSHPMRAPWVEVWQIGSLAGHGRTVMWEMRARVCATTVGGSTALQTC